jgi:hypothetical protein
MSPLTSVAIKTFSPSFTSRGAELSIENDHILKWSQPASAVEERCLRETFEYQTFTNLVFE